MIRAIALDDEPPALEIINAFCERIDSIELRMTFTRSSEAFDFLQQNEIDLVFLDINMPSVSGIDFYKKITQPVMVIFTTSYTEFAVESYQLNALDYLVKPFTFQRFLQAVTKADELFQLRKSSLQADSPFIILRVDYGLVKVLLADIRYVEGLDNYLKIYTDENPLVVRITLKALLEKLPSSAFARVHKSYIVSLAKVQSMRNKIITMKSGEEIPLGSSYEVDFLKFFGKL